MAKKKSLAIKNQAKTITFELEGRGTFEVPLPQSLPLSLNRSLWEAQKIDDDGTAAFEWSIEFFRKYLGDVVDDLTLDEYVQMSQAWQTAGEASLGESSA